MKQFLRWVSAFFIVFCSFYCKKKEGACPSDTPGNAGYIISDDVLMLTEPATGLEDEACARFSRMDTDTLDGDGSLRVPWSDGKTLEGCDSIQILRFEILRHSMSAKFTMILRPSADTTQIQCMKGYGCASWDTLDWKSPNGNFLDHPDLEFKVIPAGRREVIIENSLAEQLIVKLNPPPM